MLKAIHNSMSRHNPGAPKILIEEIYGELFAIGENCSKLREWCHNNDPDFIEFTEN